MMISTPVGRLFGAPSYLFVVSFTSVAVFCMVVARMYEWQSINHLDICQVCARPLADWCTLQ